MSVLQAKEDREETEAAIQRNQNWFRGIFSSSDQASKAKWVVNLAKRDAARKELRVLEDLARLHFFDLGENLLWKWQEELSYTRTEVKLIKAAATDGPVLKPESKDYVCWQSFQRSMNLLRPELEKLAKAHEDQKLSRLVSEEKWRERTASCCEKVKQVGEIGKQKRSDDCFFDGLVITSFEPLGRWRAGEL